MQAKLKSEPDYLLLLTRTKTKTDFHGKQDSIRVFLIPPPDGEEFEGGYHIERNHITGGIRLVGPAKGKNPDFVNISASYG